MSTPGTGSDPMEREIDELRRLSLTGGGDSRGWKFNRDELYERREEAVGEAPVPRVAALVLSYQGRDVTLGALESLTRQDYPACDLAVIDNGSTDGTAEAVAAARPGVAVLRAAENRGPVGGVNLGLAWARAGGYDYALVLNNDIEADPGLVGALVAAAEADPTIGCVGPKAYYYRERDRIWSAGGRIRFREAVTAEAGEGEVDRGQWDRDREVGYVNGCAMLIRRAALEAAGPWDPLYFLGVEDADFCLRVRRAGYRCWYAHRARLWHMVARTAGGYKPARTFNTGRNTALFVRRWGSPRQKLRAALAAIASLPLAFLRELPRRNTAAVTAKARGFFAGLREPLPPPPRWDRPGDWSPPAAGPVPAAPGAAGAR